MKKGCLGLILAGISTWCMALPISKQAQQEASLFNEFLAAAYAQRQADPNRFSKLRRALKHMPDSAYLKQQLVAEALAVDVVELADFYVDFIEDPSAQTDPDAWAVYGAYQWRKGDWKKATSAYEKALELDPDDEHILFQYMTVLAAADPDKAASTLDQLASNRPLFAADIYSEKGRMFFFYKRYPEALEAFNKALSLEPQHVTARLGRADVYEKTSQYFLMLHELEELDKMGVATSQMLARMGAVYVLVQDLPKAETYFTRAKELDKGNIPANNFLAILAEKRGEYDKAVTFLQDTADYAEDPAKQVQVSYYQRKLGQEKESLQTIRRAHELFADNGDVTYLYAVALNEQKDYRAASKLLKPLVEKFPQSEDARLQYAFALEGARRYKQMEEQVNILLDKNPKNAAALNLLAFSLAERGERLNEAAEYAARALAVWPEDFSLIDTQAWIFYKQGKFSQALDLVRTFPAQYIQANPEIAYHAGMIYAANGQPQAARAYLQQAADGGWKPAKKALKKLK